MPVWTTPKTYTVGEIHTSSDHNTYERDNLRYVKGQLGTIAFEAGATFAGAITPSADIGQDLGATATRWKVLYASRAFFGASPSDPGAGNIQVTGTGIFGAALVGLTSLVASGTGGTAKLQLGTTSIGAGEFEIVGQRAADGVVGGIAIVNNAIGGAEKRLAAFYASRSGVDNTGLLDFYMQSAGTLTKRLSLTGAGGLYLGTSTTTDPGAGNFFADGEIRARQAGSTRYRASLSVGSGATGFDAYDDTGAAYIQANWRANKHSFLTNQGADQAMLLYASRGVSIGNTTTDPGADNLSVVGSIIGPSGVTLKASGSTQVQLWTNGSQRFQADQNGQFAPVDHNARDVGIASSQSLRKVYAVGGVDTTSLETYKTFHGSVDTSAALAALLGTPLRRFTFNPPPMDAKALYEQRLPDVVAQATAIAEAAWREANPAPPPADGEDVALEPPPLPDEQRTAAANAAADALWKSCGDEAQQFLDDRSWKQEHVGIGLTGEANFWSWDGEHLNNPDLTWRVGAAVRGLVAAILGADDLAALKARLTPLWVAEPA